MRTTLITLTLILAFTATQAQDVFTFKTTNMYEYKGYDGIPDRINTYTGYFRAYWVIDTVNSEIRRYWDKKQTDLIDVIDNSDGHITIDRGFGYTFIKSKTYTMPAIGGYTEVSYMVKKEY